MFSVTKGGGGALRQGLGRPLFPIVLIHFHTVLGISPASSSPRQGWLLSEPVIVSHEAFQDREEWEQRQIPHMCSVIVTHRIIWPHGINFQVFLLNISFHQTKMTDYEKKKVLSKG